ncbi:MAG: sodium/solute symporter [Planctomycetes bacterium]|nr:sodium/solute symporter [Planctomycetota bacterium]
MGIVDIAVFLGFIGAVLALGLWKSRAGAEERSAQDFFLAGRGLSWWLIGFSLIAANISTEQFVGMSGNAASHVGLAIASYEWMAAITLVVVAFCFLPYFLRAGIYTMPEFLEYRFNSAARLIMATATVLIYLLLLGAVTYSGALTVQTLGSRYGMEIALWQPSLFIALIAMIYVVCGGLKASVWADLLQGSALILGGAVIMVFAFSQLASVEEAATVVDVSTGEVVVIQLDAQQGALERFMELNANRLNMFLPADDHVLPWTALMLGLWIPNFYYWGLNQYITQRTLGSSSLSEGQKGIVFAAFLKLIIPFVVVIPGIIAFNLFHHEMQLDSRGDAGKAMALYLKANPDTQYVRTVDGPDNQAVEAHTGPVYLIALYESADDVKAIDADNPFVLPMLDSEYEAVEPAPYQIFSDKEDHAWKHVNPELAQEIAAYNQAVLDAAEEAQAKTSKQALVAYKYDTALGQLLGMLPQNVGLFGFVLAALLGAVISSLAAMLNAASSIFTLDLVQKWVIPNASQKVIVFLGRVAVVMFTGIAAWLAPQLSDPNLSNSVFTIIQKGQGLISPGILSIFAYGLIFRRAPRMCGVVGLLVNIACYGGLWYLSANTLLFEDIDFLNNFLNWMAISFFLCVVVMTIMTIATPLKEPIQFVSKTQLDLTGSKGALKAGILCVILTLALYVVFSPLGIAR